MDKFVAQFIGAGNRFENPCPGTASATTLQVNHLQCRYPDDKFQHKVKLLLPTVSADVFSSLTASII